MWVLGAVVATAGGLAAAAPTKAAKKPPAAAKPAGEAPASPDPAPPAADEDPLADIRNDPNYTIGPKLIDLGEGLEVELPAGMVMIGRAKAAEMMVKSGGAEPGLKGIIVQPGSAGEWALNVTLHSDGYVSDDDAQDLNATEMLDSYREGTKTANVTRRANGVPEMTIDNWQTPPRYDRSQRALLWGINGHNSEGKIVNYFTNKLGRHGYVDLTLIADADKLTVAQQEATPLLSAVRFKAGARYDEYDSSADKSSGLGLKALVLGVGGVVVAKKTGLLLGLLLMMKKGLVLIFVPIIAFFKRVFGGKKAAAAPAVPLDDVDPTDPPSTAT